MKRLLSTVACDVRLQARNGFYWAVAFMLTVFAILISQIHLRNWDYFAKLAVLDAEEILYENCAREDHAEYQSEEMRGADRGRVFDEANSIRNLFSR